MNNPGQYTRYHPRFFQARMPLLWWLKSGPYLKFILRELTSEFVAFFATLYLWQLGLDSIEHL